MFFSFMRISLSAVLITSITASSIAPSYAVREGELVINAPVARRARPAVNYPALRNKRLDRLNESSLINSLFKTNAITDPLLSYLDHEDLQRMRLVSKRWNRAVQLAEQDSSTLHVTPDELVGPLRPASRFAKLVIDRGIVTADQVSQVSWKMKSLEVTLKDYDALKAVIDGTNGFQEIHVHMGEFLDFSDRAEIVMNQLGRTPTSDIPQLEKNPSPQYDATKESWPHYQGRLKAWAADRYQEIRDEKPVPQKPLQRNVRDLTSLAMSVKNAETAVVLLDAIQRQLDLDNIYIAPPKLKDIIVFINQFVGDFTSLPDDQGQTSSMQSDVEPDVLKKLTALQDQLGSRLRLYSLNDIFEDIKGLFNPQEMKLIHGHSVAAFLPIIFSEGLDEMDQSFFFRLRAFSHVCCNWTPYYDDSFRTWKYISGSTFRELMGQAKPFLKNRLTTDYYTILMPYLSLVPRSERSRLIEEAQTLSNACGWSALVLVNVMDMILRIPRAERKQVIEYSRQIISTQPADAFFAPSVISLINFTSPQRRENFANNLYNALNGYLYNALNGYNSSKDQSIFAKISRLPNFWALGAHFVMNLSLGRKIGFPEPEITAQKHILKPVLYCSAYFTSTSILMACMANPIYFCFETYTLLFMVVNTMFLSGL